MTATERLYRGHSDEIASMDDTDLYGDTFEMLSFKEALECDPPILSDYRIVTLFVSRKEIKNYISKNIIVKPDRGQWNKELEAEMLAALVALRKTIKKHKVKHAVSFHGTVARADAFSKSQGVFSETFPEYGKLDTYHVSGKTPTAVRSRAVEDFAESKRALITNARCLTEGVDVPGIDCVLFADPKRSTVDIVQAVGRALRRAEGKKLGYVIVPIIRDNEITDAEDLDESAFDTILMVLRAMASNDERIAEYFRSKAVGRNGGGGNGDGNVLEFTGIDVGQFRESVELRLWSRLAKLSWRPFEEARAFVHRLELKSVADWEDYLRGNRPDLLPMPQDIPRKPRGVYLNEGWRDSVTGSVPER